MIESQGKARASLASSQKGQWVHPCAGSNGQARDGDPGTDLFFNEKLVITETSSNETSGGSTPSEVLITSPYSETPPGSAVARSAWPDIKQPIGGVVEPSRHFSPFINSPPPADRAIVNESKHFRAQLPEWGAPVAGKMNGILQNGVEHSYPSQQSVQVRHQNYSYIGSKLITVYSITSLPIHRSTEKWVVMTTTIPNLVVLAVYADCRGLVRSHLITMRVICSPSRCLPNLSSQ